MWFGNLERDFNKFCKVMVSRSHHKEHKKIHHKKNLKYHVDDYKN
jgi:hypothetical protein